MTQLIAEGLFRVEGDRAVLIGSRRRPGAAVKFPAESDVLLDGDGSAEKIELGTEGTLYTFTTQQFLPPAPYKGKRSIGDFAPYIVAYVELPEGLLVETIVVDAEVGDLRFGQKMVSTTTLLETDQGETLLTYAFTPVPLG